MRSARDEQDRNESVLYRLAQTSGKPGAVDCVTPPPGAPRSCPAAPLASAPGAQAWRPAAVVGWARISAATARHSSEDGPSPSGKSTAR